MFNGPYVETASNPFTCNELFNYLIDLRKLCDNIGNSKILNGAWQDLVQGR